MLLIVDIFVRPSQYQIDWRLNTIPSKSYCYFAHETAKFTPDAQHSLHSQRKLRSLFFLFLPP